MEINVKNLTLDEKLKLLVGNGRWLIDNANGKLPEIFLCDGPHGVRNVKHQAENFIDESNLPSTAMPNVCLLASTWDKGLAYLDGQTIADDCLEHQVDVLLAPGVNIKRTPLCGRNFEYFSEDPYLAGVMAKAYIEGVQDKGIGTSLKHFCANNREYDRLLQTSEVDERTLREIYLTPFEIALKAKPWTVMCSYNPVNGVYASENKWLLNDVLRGEFGFDGLIVSDWYATHHPVRAVKATLDLTMPENPKFVDELKKAVQSGWLTEEEIDQRVNKILELMLKAQTSKKTITTTQKERHENATRIAREGMVLLKNQDDILPLNFDSILIEGPFKNNAPMGGGGSSKVHTAFKERSLKEELKERLPENVKIDSTKAYVWVDRAHRLKDAYLGAYHTGAVILCMGNNVEVEAENHDKKSMRLNVEQEDFILGVAKVNKNVIVVLHSGTPVDMSAWIDKVKAVLWVGYAGEGAQEAIADILSGKVCPSGKLAETFPLCIEDTPTGTARGNGFYERYKEGVFVGYRWYDELEKDVLFPFGHGLSYAKFEYSNLKIEKLGETDYEVSFSIKNLSNFTAKEVAQVYVKDVFSMVSRPQKELKAFTKVELKGGETKTVSVKLNARSFAYYGVIQKDWVVESGDFEILVGASSRDIKLVGKIEINVNERQMHTQTVSSLW